LSLVLAPLLLLQRKNCGSCEKREHVVDAKHMDDVSKGRMWQIITALFQ